MNVWSPCDVSTIIRQGIYLSSSAVSFIAIFVFRRLQRKDGSDTNTETQSGAIANAVQTEQEEGAPAFLDHFP